MNIVANSYFLRNLRKLEFFKMNLGKSRKLMGIKDEKETFRKLSEFDIKYGNLYGRTLLSYGDIGRAKFFEDVQSERYKILIFKDEDIYEIEWTENDIEDIEDYILTTLRKIDELDNIEDEIQEIDNYKNSQLETNSWVATDEKNKGKKYSINQTLSKEEYRLELLKRK